MVARSDGKVAVQRLRQQGRMVRMGDGTEYLFVIRANIPLAWVSPEHVDQVLAITRQCCGGNRRKEFQLASDDHVRRWLNNGGR
ncbi:MAG: hypothetical protein H8D23_29845 [Candidatus Brocadiales bacterium]|nr:hypothetical protein [Candidatus Brocadiales bacterium]